MTIYVYEELTASPSANEFPASMWQEGWAMLTAVCRDLAQVDRVIPIVHESRSAAGLVGEPLVWTSELSFEELLDRVDPHGRWLVIAPETDGLLRRRTWAVEERGYPLISAPSPWVELGSDKLRLAQWAGKWSVPTAQTLNESAAEGDGIVAKRRDGAGCTDIYASPATESGLAELRELMAARPGGWVIQPWIDGPTVRWLSQAFVGRGDGAVIALPMADQWIERVAIAGSSLSTFRYVGGRVPADVGLEGNWNESDLVRELFGERSRLAADGCRGFFGLDLVDDGVAQRVVELNPRLTTSYIGYSRWISQASGKPDTMGRLLLGHDLPAIDRDTPAVSFRADGTILDGHR
jgi:predicted ATP-grasp superfamily ATP-dependent carboligase